MKATLINLLCQLVIRLASLKGDKVAQLNILHESGNATIFFGSGEEADKAITMIREAQRLTPEARERLGEAIRFASETMEHHPMNDSSRS